MSLHLVGGTRSLFFLIRGFWRMYRTLTDITFHFIHFAELLLCQSKHILALADYRAHASLQPFTVCSAWTLCLFECSYYSVTWIEQRLIRRHDTHRISVWSNNPSVSGWFLGSSLVGFFFIVSSRHCHTRVPIQFLRWTPSTPHCSHKGTFCNLTLLVTITLLIYISLNWKPYVARSQ